MSARAFDFDDDDDIWPSAGPASAARRQFMISLALAGAISALAAFEALTPAATAHAPRVAPVELPATTAASFV